MQIAAPLVGGVLIGLRLQRCCPPRSRGGGERNRLRVRRAFRRPEPLARRLRRRPLRRRGSCSGSFRLRSPAGVVRWRCWSSRASSSASARAWAAAARAVTACAGSPGSRRYRLSPRSRSWASRWLSPSSCGTGSHEDGTRLVPRRSRLRGWPRRAGNDQPARRWLAFLDVTGAWDPSLAFVMIGAIGVHALAWAGPGAVRGRSGTTRSMFPHARPSIAASLPAPPCSGSVGACPVSARDRESSPRARSIRAGSPSSCRCSSAWRSTDSCATVGSLAFAIDVCC